MLWITFHWRGNVQGTTKSNSQLKVHKEYFKFFLVPNITTFFHDIYYIVIILIQFMTILIYFCMEAQTV
jgi:hypothetical protein